MVNAVKVRITIYYSLLAIISVVLLFLTIIIMSGFVPVRPSEMIPTVFIAPIIINGFVSLIVFQGKLKEHNTIMLVIITHIFYTALYGWFVSAM